MTPELTAETLAELEDIHLPKAKAYFAAVCPRGNGGSPARCLDAIPALIEAARDLDELRERVRELEAKIEDREQDAMAAD